MRVITEVIEEIKALYKKLDLLEEEIDEINLARWEELNGM